MSHAIQIDALFFFMKQNYFNISTECSYFQNRPD